MDDLQPLRGQTIRHVILDGLPHFCAGSVCLALGISVDTLAERVADEHYRVAPIPIEDGSEAEGVVLTPIGLFTLALYHDTSTCMAVHRWVFRETKRLIPDAFNRDRYGAAVMMALRPDGDVPPRPHIKTGRQSEWAELKFRNDYVSPTVRHRRAINAVLANNRAARQMSSANLPPRITT